MYSRPRLALTITDVVLGACAGVTVTAGIAALVPLAVTLAAPVELTYFNWERLARWALLGTALVGVISGVWVSRGRVADRRRTFEHALQQNACPSCGYDLRGTCDPRCPECGGAFTAEEWALTGHESGVGVKPAQAPPGSTPASRAHSVPR